MDFGLRRLGIALSDETKTLASPLRVLEIASVRQAPQAVAEVAMAKDIDTVVVGVPLGLEGEERRQEVRRVERFASALRKLTGKEVFLVDESFTTRDASDHDQAAALILQRWLDRPGTRGKA